MWKCMLFCASKFYPCPYQFFYVQLHSYSVSYLLTLFHSYKTHSQNLSNYIYSILTYTVPLSSNVTLTYTFIYIVHISFLVNLLHFHFHFLPSPQSSTHCLPLPPIISFFPLSACFLYLYLPVVLSLVLLFLSLRLTTIFLFLLPSPLILFLQ